MIFEQVKKRGLGLCAFFPIYHMKEDVEVVFQVILHHFKKKEIIGQVEKEGTDSWVFIQQESFSAGRIH